MKESTIRVIVGVLGLAALASALQLAMCAAGERQRERYQECLDTIGDPVFCWEEER